MSTVSDFNLTSLNTKQLADNLEATIEYGGAVFVCGRRGSAKTAISKQSIAKSKKRELYLNASTFDRVDFSGYPRITGSDQRDEFVKYLLPEYYRALVEGNEPCVTLLDEIDKSDQSVLAPLLEFIQFHTINGRALKNHHATIMTGNLIAEGGQRPSLPLLDRAEKYLVEVNNQHWTDWAAAYGEIHSSVLAYLQDNPDDLVGEVDPGELFADSSPRAWHNASKLLTFGEHHKWNKDVLKTKVSGCVGKKIGIKYNTYFDHYVVLLPLVEKVMEGTSIESEFNRLKPSEQLVCSFIVTARLAKEIDKKKDLQKAFRNVGRFLQTIDMELSLLAIRNGVGLNRLTTVMSAGGFDKFPEFDSLLEQLRKRMFTGS